MGSHLYLSNNWISNNKTDINNLEADMNLCCDINDINDINNLEVDMNLCCEAVVAMIVW